MTRIALSLVAGAIFLAPVNVLASNNRNTVKIPQCIENTGAPQFLTCNDLEMLDIR